MGFQVASYEHIKQGRVTDVYFERVKAALSSKGINPLVDMEVRAGSLPDEWKWAVFAGLEEVLELVDGLPIEVLRPDGATAVASLIAEGLVDGPSALRPRRVLSLIHI